MKLPLAKKIYKKIIQKLRRDLGIDEVRHQNINLLHILGSINQEIVNTNLFVGGAALLGTQSFPEQRTIETSEIMQIISGDAQSDNDTLWFQNLKNETFKNKHILLVDTGEAVFLNTLKSKKPKSLTHIVLSATQKTRINTNTLYLHPSDIHSFLPQEVFDVLVIPNALIASLFIKHQLFKFGSYIREQAIIRSRIHGESFPTKKLEPLYIQKEDAFLWNDNYLRSQIHSSGFVEIVSELQNQTKISRFSYEKGLRIISKLSRKKQAFSSGPVTFIAYKLPQVK